MVSTGAPRYLTTAPGRAPEARLVVSAILKIWVAVQAIEKRKRALDHVMQVSAKSFMAS